MERQVRIDTAIREITEEKMHEAEKGGYLTQEEFEDWLSHRLDQTDQLREEFDDNGDLYRIGNDLKPDNRYEINGYQYQTDSIGRIISAQGKLHLKDREARLPIKDSINDVGKGDQELGDDRGHLIGDQFDGSNGLENLIPQDAHINRNDFKNFENDLAKELRNERDVRMKVEPLYDDLSRRPSMILVTYSIDGDENIRFFPNKREVAV